MLLEHLHHELTVLYKIPKKPIVKTFTKKNIISYPEVPVISINKGCVSHCYYFNKESKYYAYDYLNGGNIFYTEEDLQPTFYYSHSERGIHYLKEAPQELLKAIDNRFKIQESYRR